MRDLLRLHRMRGGTIEDLAGHEDLDSYDDENYTIALRWENDNFTADIRGNARSYGRVLSWLLKELERLLPVNTVVLR